MVEEDEVEPGGHVEDEAAYPEVDAVQRKHIPGVPDDDEGPHCEQPCHQGNALAAAQVPVFFHKGDSRLHLRERAGHGSDEEQNEEQYPEELPARHGGKYLRQYVEAQPESAHGGCCGHTQQRQGCRHDGEPCQAYFGYGVGSPGTQRAQRNIFAAAHIAGIAADGAGAYGE